MGLTPTSIYGTISFASDSRRAQMWKWWWVVRTSMSSLGMASIPISTSPCLNLWTGGRKCGSFLGMPPLRRSSWSWVTSLSPNLTSGMGWPRRTSASCSPCARLFNSYDRRGRWACTFCGQFLPSDSTTLSRGDYNVVVFGAKLSRPPLLWRVGWCSDQHPDPQDPSPWWVHWCHTQF
jgi:hypothetical protein